MNAETNSTGRIIVKAFLANVSLPVAGAVVTVRIIKSGEKPVTIGVYETNIDGETAPFVLETPPAQNSLAPGMGQIPYTSANIEVSADGFYFVTFSGVPVFPGITSIQSARMIPLPDSYGNYYPISDIIVNESKAPNL